MDNNEKKASGLKGGFTPLGMWAFSIGTSIGWGSFIVTCNTYLQKSGILGTVFGLIVGMAVIFVITWNLQYMIRKSPSAGGIYTFEKKIGGKDLGFLAYWFVLLTYLAILWANITSVPLFARFFLGNIFQFGFHYTIFGYEVWLGEALLSMLAVAIIALLCANCAKLPNKIMIVAALIFAVGFTACAVIAIFKHDNSFNYSPLYTEGSGAFSQIVRIAAISPWAFIGFENISHFSEEYKFPIKKVRSILISSVIVTTVLYIFVSLLSISAYPPEYASWLEYIKDMGNLSGIKAVPAFYAANHYLGQAGVTVLMCALFTVILTSLIGNMLALSRLLFAAGREGDAPKMLGTLNKKGIPNKAIYVIAAMGMVIPFLGRTAIGWIVDVTTLGATIIYGLISHSVFLHAKKNQRKVEKITGIAGIVLMICFVLLLLIPGLLPFDAMETESYILFIFWAVMGLVYFRILIRRDESQEYGKQRVTVWIILLLLVLFASMMWVSRATENAADTAVHQIYEYHESHAQSGNEVTEEERLEFLEGQSKIITQRNTLYTIVSLSLFLLSTAIMLNNYQDTKRLDKHLSAARKTALTDALTGVNNKLAFAEAEHKLDAQIKSREVLPFALVVCDINDLKGVNDRLGHKAGDQYIVDSCKAITKIFKHSLVYRIGGDEFAVICQGRDYEHIDALLEEMRATNENRDNNIQISYGMAKYIDDFDVDSVFDRADKRMYERKAFSKHMLPTFGKNPIEGSEQKKYEFDDDLKQIYESSPLSFVYYQNINHQAVPVLASDGFCRNTSMSREKVLDWLQNGMFERMHPDDVGVMKRISDDFLHHRGPYDVFFRCRLDVPDSDEDVYVQIHATGKWQTMPDGTELALIAYANVSQTQKLSTENLDVYTMFRKDTFYTDHLTDLPNINYLHEFGNERLNSIRADGNVPVLIYSDVHSMQSYNNQYGYKAGDDLLCTVAKSLKEQFPRSLITRGPDDHFIIISPTDTLNDLKDKLYEANKKIRQSVRGNTSGIRSGVYPISDPKTELIDALDRARQALKLIENDLNREVEFYSHTSNKAYLRERYIVENFERALQEGWIKVYYHSLNRVESQKIAAFEALARWVDPNRGKIYPNDFIPALLKHHLLYKLDLYMFEQVCREVIIRYENGLPLVPVSINFSRQDFLHADIVESMNELFEKYSLSKYIDKGYFIVEITEQDLANGERKVIDQLKQIRENGYRLWLDDFGSGYSAINVFSHFEFDLIKYDMELMRHLDDNGGMNRVILRELVQIAKELGIHTLVEGLETEEHLAFLKEIGCELAQGFYYNKPESLDEILGEIEKGRIVRACETPEERVTFSKKWHFKNKE